MQFAIAHNIVYFFFFGERFSNFGIMDIPKPRSSQLVVSLACLQSLQPSTLNTITAATRIGGDIDVLVAGKNPSGAAKHASRIKGVKKVLVANKVFFYLSLHEFSKNIERIRSRFWSIRWQKPSFR
jgi:hypothetical protein